MKEYTLQVYENYRVWVKGGRNHREDGPAVEYVNGDFEWYLNGKLHREDGPAVSRKIHEKEWWVEWWLNGKQHRIGGPAVENVRGKFWYENGKRHRTDGPAFEDERGNKQWYLNGKLHRTDGPAVVREDGSKFWWLNDKRHRTDGPAVEYANGGTEWWIDGIEYDEEEFEYVHKAKNPIDFLFAPDFSVKDPFYVKFKENGVKYNTVKVFDDRMEWFKDGALHRENGPAIEYNDGINFWYLNGEQHREDGPAVEYPNGYKAWYLNGTKYTEEEFHEKIKRNEHKERYLNFKRSLTAEQMLDDELVMCHLGTLDSFQSPYDALQDLINFHIDLERYMSKQKN